MNLQAARQSVQLKGFEPDQLASLLSNTQLEHTLLSSAKCNITHQRWVCGALAIDRGFYDFPVRISGGFPQKRVCVGYMGTLSAPTWVNGFQAGLHSIEIYSAGSEVNYRAGADGEWVAISVEEEALQSAATQLLGRQFELPQASTVSLRVQASLRNEIDNGVRRMMLQEQPRKEVIEEFIGYLADLLSHLCKGDHAPLIRRSLQRKQLVERAEEYLRNHVHEPFDASRLATALQTTERSLQRHFATAYGTTPHEWARILALHRARERLRRTNPRLTTIESVARAFGFEHMGRFAEYYWDLFGELPSVTLTATPRLK